MQVGHSFQGEGKGVLTHFISPEEEIIGTKYIHSQSQHFIGGNVEGGRSVFPDKTPFLQGISWCRKFYLMQDVKCICLGREHRDFGELAIMGIGGSALSGRGRTWRQVLEFIEVSIF